MITYDIATNAKHGTVFYSTMNNNADGTPVRCRVNGACKTWKTRPGEFRLPVKYGLKVCFYITNEYAHEWAISECAAVAERD